MKKFIGFFRKYGHKILTFCIGLAFLATCGVLLWLGGLSIYHMFRPADIYNEGWDSDLVWASMAFDELRDTGLEEGSADFFEVYTANFVREDFKSFKNPLELNTEYFISYGIWQAMDANSHSIYHLHSDGENERGYYLIPKADVEKFARYNFEYEGEFEHKDIPFDGGAFEYDSFSGCYKVPAGLGYSYLVPDVIDVKVDEEANQTTLTIDCYQSDGLTLEDVTQNKDKFVKRISITLQNVEEVKNVDGEEKTYMNYMYLSCSRVDETVSTGGNEAQQEADAENKK